MQRWVKQLDATRPVTVAISGGWGGGLSEVIEVAGLNYLGNLNKGGFTTDQWHARRPNQPILGTEECAFHQTRGIYFDDRKNCHLRAYDWDPSEWGASLEQQLALRFDDSRRPAGARGSARHRGAAPTCRLGEPGG